jgi:hypothetical protein
MKAFFSSPHSHPRPECKVRTPAISAAPNWRFLPVAHPKNQRDEGGDAAKPGGFAPEWFYTIHASLPEVDSSMHFTRGMD